jgi:hypothetical protein
MKTGSLKVVYKVPFVLSVLTCAGLLSALLGDGLWDAISWVLLLAPLLLLSFFLYRSKKANFH